MRGSEGVAGGRVGGGCGGSVGRFADPDWRGGAAADRSVATVAGAGAWVDTARDQFSASAGRNAWPRRRGQPARAAGLPVSGHQVRRLLERDRARTGSVLPGTSSTGSSMPRNAAGKQIILCVGAVKTFGYPEFFVPAHHLPKPLREGALVEPADHHSTARRGDRVQSPGSSSATAIMRRSSPGRSSTRRPIRSAWSIPGDCRRLRAAGGCRRCARPIRAGRS